MNNNPARMLIYLLGVICVLVILHLMGQVYRYEQGIDGSIWIQLINLDEEISLPTLFVTLEWLTCVFILGYIAIHRKPLSHDHVYWAVLSLLFLFLTLDEVFSFHERISWRVRFFLNTSGLLRFAWIIPYTIFVIILASVYRRFLFDLRPTIRRLFFLSATIFLIGAIGVEAIEGRHVDQYGKDRVYYLYYTTLEEGLEMTGLAIFIYPLYVYLGTELSISRLPVYPIRIIYSTVSQYIRDCFTGRSRNQ